MEILGFIFKVILVILAGVFALYSSIIVNEEREQRRNERNKRD